MLALLGRVQKRLIGPTFSVLDILNLKCLFGTKGMYQVIGRWINESEVQGRGWSGNMNLGVSTSK